MNRALYFQGCCCSIWGWNQDLKITRTYADCAEQDERRTPATATRGADCALDYDGPATGRRGTAQRAFAGAGEQGAPQYRERGVSGPGAEGLDHSPARESADGGRELRSSL